MKTENIHSRISARQLFRNIFSIREGTDIGQTITGIKKDIAFKGPTLWILMFSILIASIGLNANSVAVIIGAMLISPLMGPILGIGLSIGTNDLDTLMLSMKNFGIAIGIALLTSTLYFAITPLDLEQSELLSRTRPTLLDVLIGLFGGFAGIIAGSRREKSNVIPGVAIATALMPPLCTAGYGLANLNMAHFLGAFYLFFINSVFIALSTFLVVKYLRFPLVTYQVPRRWLRYRILLYIFLAITILPSTVIFTQVIREARFNVGAEKFVVEQARFNGKELFSHRISFNDSANVIDLFYIGNKVSPDEEKLLNRQLTVYGIEKQKGWLKTKPTLLRVHQERDESFDMEQRFDEFNQVVRLRVLEDIYEKSESMIRDKDDRIQFLENELVLLKQQDQLPWQQVGKELKFHFPEVDRFSYARLVEVSTVADSLRLDTIPTFLVSYDPGISVRVRKQNNEKVRKWLQIRLEQEDIRVREL